MITKEDLFKRIKEYNPNELEMIQKAYDYAKFLHQGQTRQSGEPYISHPLNVAYILAEMHADRDTVCAALLHDTLEDTKTDKEDIAEMFGKDVTNLVDGVTKISKMNFKCMIVDESSVMKNMTAQITSEILSMIDVVPRRYVLSGTPNPNSNLELFPQMKFVLPDLFGSSFYGWQATYFHQDMADPHKWYQTQEDKERLFSRLSEGSVFLKKEECIDLPPKIFLIREYTMCKEQEEYYMDMVNNIRDNINQWSKFEFTAKLMKLREILSGFVINKDDTVSEFKSSKTEVLKQVIEEIGDKPIIVWCQFQYEIETLAKEFDGVALTSKTKNRNQIIRDFKEGKIHLLFTHPKLLGKGLTFTNCTYNIYYSVSFSYEEFAQSQDRIHRIGQDNKCTYIILQAKNTIDETIYRCLQRKKNVVDELYLKMGMKI